jgi:hypothetical protein
MNEVDLRTYVTFEAKISDGPEFTGTGEIRRPGGLKIAQFLRETLARSGLEVSAPKLHGYYGWAFVAKQANLKVWFLVQFPGPWLLLSIDRTSFIRRILSSKSSLWHRRTLETLNNSLSRDDRFGNIRWFFKREFEKGKDRSTGGRTP